MLSNLGYPPPPSLALLFTPGEATAERTIQPFSGTISTWMSTDGLSRPPADGLITDHHLSSTLPAQRPIGYCSVQQQEELVHIPTKLSHTNLVQLYFFFTVSPEGGIHQP